MTDNETHELGNKFILGIVRQNLVVRMIKNRRKKGKPVTIYLQTIE